MCRIFEHISSHFYQKQYSNSISLSQRQSLRYAVNSMRAVEPEVSFPRLQNLYWALCRYKITKCPFLKFMYFRYIRRVFRKRPNFINSAPTTTQSALRLLTAPSVKFWQQTAICPFSLWALVVELHTLKWASVQAVRRISDKEEIQESAIRELGAITESAFQEEFQQQKKGWERCIASRGD
jgi:hypothetical protein